MPRPSTTSKSDNPTGKRKAVTIEISSDDDNDGMIDKLVSGKSTKKTVKKPEVKRPAITRKSTSGSASGFGGFVSAFDPHPNRPSGSQESGSSRSFQPLVKAPQLGRGAGIQPSASSSTSKSVPARKKGSIRAREGEEPIVTDLVSSPRFSADDALLWEPSDSEVELVSVNISSRRKAITSKAGVQDSERGTKRKREIIGKADEADIAESESSQPSSMWADKYAPTTIADLAPSKTRISQVKSWLEEALYGRPAGLDVGVNFSKQAAERVRKYRRILLLTGPAGVGKSTSVRAIAGEMGVEVVEWNEGFEDWGFRGDVERESLTSKLITFLSRNSYSSLPIAGIEDIRHSSSSQTQPTRSTTNPRLLLITSLPNLSHYPTRQAFHGALLDFTRDYSSNSSPLVVVLPDVGHSGAAEEPWSARGRADNSSDGAWDLKSVVGEAVLVSPAVTTIDFLSMAPTFITKALKRVLNLAIPIALDQPSNDVVQLIAQTSNGDLRSAVNSLEMLMKTSSAALTSAVSGKSALPKKGKGSRGGGKGKASGSKEMQILLNQVARREQSLGLFHALGKVLYNKRIGETSENGDDDGLARAKEAEYLATNPLPNHLRRHSRPRFENDFEDLLSTAPVDTATFMLWVHQNMPQFCADVDELDECLEAICDADRMKTDDDLWQRSSQAIAYAFHVAVRGVVAGLPAPVPKNHQKMFKPDFFRWIKSGKVNQATLADVTRWLARAGDSVSPRDSLDGMWEPTDNQEDVSTNMYRGQRSNAILATEFLPMIRLLKRRGHDVPISTENEPFTSLNENMNDLDILGEKDDGADLSNDHETNETITTFATSSKFPTAEHISDEELLPPTTSTYLLDDDIEDDD